MNRLRELREKANLTQEYMAKLMSKTRPAYTRWETGQYEPDNETLQKLAVFFNVSIDYLLERTDDPSPPGTKKDSPAELSDDDIMFALLDGDADDITDEMFAEVKEFARFVKEREKRKRRDGTG